MKITETKKGLIIEVFVKPKLAKFEVTLEGDEMVVRCTEEPVKGKVNKELLNALSKFLHTNVELISGVTSRQKRLLLKGIEKNDLENFLRKKAHILRKRVKKWEQNIINFDVSTENSTILS